MVGKKNRGLFMGNVELSSQERLDSKGWNRFWTEELGLVDRQFNASELAVMDMYSSDESRDAAAVFFLNPTVGNMAKSAFSEAGSQWMDPEKLVMGASIGVGGLSALGGMGSAAKGGIQALKPLGLGSTGRTAAANLTEQLAMKEVMSNPSPEGY